MPIFGSQGKSLIGGVRKRLICSFFNFVPSNSEKIYNIHVAQKANLTNNLKFVEKYLILLRIIAF